MNESIFNMLPLSKVYEDNRNQKTYTNFTMRTDRKNRSCAILDKIDKSIT